MKHKLRAFKVKDLMVNVLAEAPMNGGAGMPGPDDDITRFPPTKTPILMVAKHTSQFEVIRKKVLENPEKAPEIIGELAPLFGAAYLGAIFLGEAAVCAGAYASVSCVVEKAYSTNYNQFPILYEDLVYISQILCETVDQISALQDARLAQAKANANEYIARLENAIEVLKQP